MIVVNILRKVKMKKIPSVDKGIEQLKLSYTGSQMINWYNHFEKLFCRIIAEHTKPLCPSDSILMYIPKEMCTYIHQKSCTRIFRKKMDRSA